MLGADILYADTNHPHLRRVFDAALTPCGRLLLADPFRADGLRLLEGLEADGWRVTMSRWAVGEGDSGRAVAVYEAAPPER